MKSAGWSTLLLGTILATAGCAAARAEGGETAVSVERMIDAAVAAGEAARDEADAGQMTGSIAPLTGPSKPGLLPLVARETKALSEITEAKEPKVEKPAPVVAKEAEKPAPTVAKEAEKPAAPSVSAPVVSAVAAVPAAPAKAEGVAPVEASAPKTETTQPQAAVAAAPETVEAPASEAKTEDAASTAASVAAAMESLKIEAPVAEAVEAPKAGAPEVEVPKADATVVATPIDTPKAEAPKAELPKAEAPKAEAPAPVAPRASLEIPKIDVPAVAAAAPSVEAPKVEASAAAVPATTATVPAGAAPVATAVPEVTAQPTVTPREADVAAAQAAIVDADALKKVVEAHALEAGTADDRRERAAVAAFYAERRHAPLFVGASDLTARARVAVERFRQADRQGLEPRDYALPAMRAATPEGRAEAEYAVAMTVLRYARHLQSGRFDPLRLSDLVTAKPPKVDPAVVLRDVATSADVAGTLDAFAPPHEGYKRLKAELARLRGEIEVPVVRLPPGPVLKPGQKDARVAMLRERLGVTAVASDAELYDPSLADVVKTFQRERGLTATGSVNRETVAALNDESRGNAERIADVVVNMERWRWLPRELGSLHVFVNIPDFFLDVMKDGKSIHHARVVTGRPSNQTPIFSETMQYVVVNPYWNVPVSIIQKEMLAKAQATGGAALSRGNFEVEVGNRTVDPTTVDWSTVSASRVSIRQRPGDGNALGNIKFMFPNQHSVYIHDTSSRGLFSQSFRALSHGCVRVHEPFSFADAVLSEEPGGLGGPQLKKMLGGGEKQVMLKRQVPVHVNYFTTWIDDAGQVQSRPDVYGHDAKMKRILGL